MKLATFNSPDNSLKFLLEFVYCRIAVDDFTLRPDIPAIAVVNSSEKPLFNHSIAASSLILRNGSTAMELWRIRSFLGDDDTENFFSLFCPSYTKTAVPFTPCLSITY